MRSRSSYTRLNIYLEDPEMRRSIKMAAANQGVTASAYCVEAIRQRLAREASVERARASAETQRVARDLGTLREQIGSVGIPVRELIDEGRSR